MELETIMQLITIVVTLILGVISKKNKFIESKSIPIQNVIIGVAMAIVHWFITKDISLAITLSGLLAGGTYDLGKNLLLIFKKEEK